MQFQLCANKPDAATLKSSLFNLDPRAEFTLDGDHGVLEVLTSLSPHHIVGMLEQLGCSATQLDRLVHISGGSTCCGSCS